MENHDDATIGSFTAAAGDDAQTGVGRPLQWQTAGWDNAGVHR
jgi:hypothetical protein